MSGIFYGGAVAKTSRQVASYAALRATVGPEQSIEVSGYLVGSKPSGIAGVFTRDEADVSSADDGGLVIVRADGVRFKRQHDGPVGVRFFDTPTDGETSASAGIQRLATLCEAGKARHVYIANWSENYLITAPIEVANPGVRVFGDAGGSYSRRTDENGWLLGADGLVRMLDFGASREGVQPADNWQLDGLSFQQAEGVAVRTVDGVGFTSKSNGPDRGAILRSVSFVGLKDAITVENPDVETVLANLDIEGSVFQGCNSAINAKGNLLGLRFVGNQCEQNAGASGEGVIRGSINGTVTITDNMLEGQPNVLSIDVPPVTGNIPQVDFSRNYLEANGGDYVVRFRNSTSAASLKVGPNFLTSCTAADYLLFDGSASGTVRLDLQDIGQTFTFKDSEQVIDCQDAMVRGSALGFYHRKSTVNRLQTVIASKFGGLVDSAGGHVRGLPASGVKVATPYGKKLCVEGGSRISVPVAVAVGDLVSVNLLIWVKESVAGTLLFQVLNPALSLYVAEGSAGYNKLNGQWALVNKTFVAKNLASALEIRTLISSGTFEIYTAGVSVKNYGAFVNDGTARQLIDLVAPNIVDIEAVDAAVDLPSIATGASYTYTMSAALPGAIVGDTCVAQLATDMADVSIYAWISAAGVGKVTFTNHNAGARDFPATDLIFRVIR